MKITFIGTSHGYPEKNRKCTCVLLETGDKKYLMDMGCNPLEYLTDVGIHIRDITAAFITHAHGDHLNGIIPVTEVINWAFRDAKIAFFVPTMRIKDVINDYKALNHAVLRDSVPFTEITEGLFYDDGVLRVTAFRNEHMDRSFSFLFEAEGKTAFFTGDLGPEGAVREYPAMVKRSYDLVACEAGHVEVMDYKPSFIATPPGQVWFYHYLPSTITQILQMQDELKDVVPVQYAVDGSVVEL